MDVLEQQMEQLLERLARENRQLLALLRLGYSLRRAELVLEEAQQPEDEQEAQRIPARSSHR